MTELTLHGARPAGVPRPRLGYAMVTGASALFAVNGTVSKVILTEGGISNLRLTELRATGAFAGLAAFVLLAAPRRLRVARDELPLLVVYGIVGFALVQWLYLVAIERLPIGIGLLLEFTAPVLVALWARLVWHEPVRSARLGGARARALGPRSRGGDLARRPPRHDRRRSPGFSPREHSRRTTSRASTRPSAATRCRSRACRSASRRSSGRSSSLGGASRSTRSARASRSAARSRPSTSPSGPSACG